MINDFQFLASSFTKCAHDLYAFMTMCDTIGVPLAPEKSMGPSTCLICAARVANQEFTTTTTYLPFLGIDLDTVNMVACLPDDKLKKASDLLSQFLQRDEVKLKQLHSLIGVLNVACKVIVPGRAFLQRLIDLTAKVVTMPHHHIRLTRKVKLNFHLWLDFLSDFNGNAFFIDERFLNGNDLQLFTDSAGGIDYGALCGAEWFIGLWPP